MDGLYPLWGWIEREQVGLGVAQLSREGLQVFHLFGVDALCGFDFNQRHRSPWPLDDEVDLGPIVCFEVEEAEVFIEVFTSAHDLQEDKMFEGLAKVGRLRQQRDGQGAVQGPFDARIKEVKFRVG